MNPYPGDNSVLLLDNCAIHKCKMLKSLLKAKGTSPCISLSSTRLIVPPGCLLLFIPPYSPELNPIEESFSAGTVFDACFIGTI